MTRTHPIAPLIQAEVERTAPMLDAFSRAHPIAPLIQAEVERTARMLDAFGSEGR